MHVVEHHHHQLLHQHLGGGAAGVVVSAKNSAPLSATVSKASAGAMEAMVIHSVSSMPRFLQGQAEAGWAVVGAAVGEDAKDCASYQLQKPTVLVMGAPRPPYRLSACLSVLRHTVPLGVNNSPGGANVSLFGLRIGVRQ
jgi:hypothetical protein